MTESHQTPEVAELDWRTSNLAKSVAQAKVAEHLTEMAMNKHAQVNAWMQHCPADHPHVDELRAERNEWIRALARYLGIRDEEATQRILDMTAAEYAADEEGEG